MPCVLYCSLKYLRPYNITFELHFLHFIEEKNTFIVVAGLKCSAWFCSAVTRPGIDSVATTLASVARLASLASVATLAKCSFALTGNTLHGIARMIKHCSGKSWQVWQYTGKCATGKWQVIKHCSGKRRHWGGVSRARAGRGACKKVRSPLSNTLHLTFRPPYLLTTLHLKSYPFSCYSLTKSYLTGLISVQIHLFRGTNTAQIHFPKWTKCICLRLKCTTFTFIQLMDSN